MSSELPHLFSPMTINQVTLRNRVFSSSHFGTWMVQNGFPNDACAAYFEERAKGGIGLLFVGATTVVENDAPSYFQNHDSRFVDSYRTLAAAIHPHGARVFAQFCVRGPNVRYSELGEPIPEPPRAASPPSSPLR